MKRPLVAQTLVLLLFLAASCCPADPCEDLPRRETRLAERESELSDWATQVAGREGRINEKHVAVVVREVGVSERETEVAHRESEVAEGCQPEPSPPPTPPRTIPPTVPPTVPPTIPPTIPPTVANGYIPCDDAGNHIGEYACVCCLIMKTYFCESCGDQPTFLNSHDPYRGHFTALIWGDNRQAFINRFGGPPEDVFWRRGACFYGLIEWYAPNEAPQIILRDPSNACVDCVSCP